MHHHSARGLMGDGRFPHPPPLTMQERLVCKGGRMEDSPMTPVDVVSNQIHNAYKLKSLQCHLQQIHSLSLKMQG